MPVASVIILNFNGKRYLKQCLDALFKQDFHDFEILFVDNASVDESADFVEELYGDFVKEKKLRIIKNKKNYGFAEGNNIGYRAAAKTSKYIVLLNNDTVVRKNWLRELITPLQSYREVGLVGTPYYGPGEWKAYQQFIHSSIIHTMTLGGEATAVPAKQQMYKQAYLRKAFFVSGNGVAIRRSMFDIPFDKDYFAYAEDAYLGWRTQLQGYEVIFNVRAVMLHIGGGAKRVSGKSFNNLLLMHGYKNQMMNHLIFYEWKNVIRAFPFLLLTHLGHVLDNPRKVGTELRALGWVMLHLPAILRKRRVIQRVRKVRDCELIRRMSCGTYNEELAAQHYNHVYQAMLRVLHGCCRTYCRFIGLSTVERVITSSYARS